MTIQHFPSSLPKNTNNHRSFLLIRLIITSLTSYSQMAYGWTTTPLALPLSNIHHHHSSSSSITRRFAAAASIENNNNNDNAVWKAEGERIILSAAIAAGASKEQLSIEWKSGRIIVTVDGDVSVGSSIDDVDEEEENVYFESGDGNGDDYDFDSYTYDDNDDGTTPSDDNDSNSSSSSTSITSIARAINAAFEITRETEGESSIGWTIAKNYEIEVTTPGFSDGILRGDVMFKAYRGFDVIVEMVPEVDKKGKKKKKVVEGKLVERNEGMTVINVKGRMRKLKNELIGCVMLPKAKREKGAR